VPSVGTTSSSSMTITEASLSYSSEDDLKTVFLPRPQPPLPLPLMMSVLQHTMSFIAQSSLLSRLYPNTKIFMHLQKLRLADAEEFFAVFVIEVEIASLPPAFFSEASAFCFLCFAVS